MMLYIQRIELCHWNKGTEAVWCQHRKISRHIAKIKIRMQNIMHNKLCLCCKRETIFVWTLNMSPQKKWRIAFTWKNIHQYKIWLGFCQLDTSKRLLRKGTLNWGNAPIRLAYGKVCEGIFLINSWCGSAHSTVGGTTPRQEVLGGVRE